MTATVHNDIELQAAAIIDRVDPMGYPFRICIGPVIFGPPAPTPPPLTAAEIAALNEAAASRARELQVEARRALVRYHVAKRRAARLRRTPPWADMQAIKAVYEEARRRTRETGFEHHVDHEIPLQGELVSGLHVANNLQILTGIENSRKKNRFEIV